MAIKVTISQQETERQKLAQESEQKPQATIKLQARKTPDGNVMIFDHKDIDIVLMPNKRKVVTFPKDQMDEIIYNTQSRLFDFLTKKGIIEFESVQGGNVFASLEGKIVESKDYNTTQLALFAISKFMDEERPVMEYEEAIEADFERRLSEPLPNESTDFDPSRHSDRKGGIRPGVQPYGISSVYRF
jgi:hypothetical protein